MFVRSVVINNKVDVELVRNIGVNVAKKGKKFLMAMPRLALGYTNLQTLVSIANASFSPIPFFLVMLYLHHGIRKTEVLINIVLQL